MTPRISVIVVTHDRRDDAAALLRGLEPLVPDVEVIVADAASSDGTVDALRAGFPWARVLPYADNPGAALMRNRALSRASGDVVVLLDDDVVLADPAALRLVAARFAADPSLAALNFRVVLHSTGHLDPHCWPWYFVDPEPRPGREVDVPMLLEGACALRRSALDRVGVFPDWPQAMGGGRDLAIRLLCAGCAVRYTDDVVVRHKRAAPGRTIRSRIDLSLRDDLWTVWRAFPWVALVPMTAAKIAVGLWRALETGGARPALRGIAAAFRDAPIAFRARRPVPRRMVPQLLGSRIRRLLVRSPRAPSGRVEEQRG